jgi:precorrin-8X/cobalt-precorrin-8 methylmutase
MPNHDVILNPQEIEARSFAIIDSEAGTHGFDAAHWPVVRRIVHTTGDFDFIANTRIAPGALAAGLTALRKGADILCDTNMVRAGVNRSRLERFGCQLSCHVADPEVASEARELGITRSIVALRKGVAEGCRIFLIGNAPTALFELMRLVREENFRPDLVVGVPVGFVGAEESKTALAATDLPYITCLGRKGGSAIAAAICNALVIQANEE